MESITIIGMGPLGASLGLALKAQAPSLNIVGFGLHREAVAEAQRLGAINRVARSLPAAVEGAEVVFIATPMTMVKEVLGNISGSVRADGIVTDTALSKTQVMEWAGQLLPPGVSFIGGHPLVEGVGVDARVAQANLFQGRTYCLLPAPNAAPGAVDTMVGLVKLMGAVPFFIDAQEHDAYVAGMAHLPFLLSCILASVTTKSPAWSQMSKFVTERYQEQCRPAWVNPELEVEVCLTNRAGNIRWIDECIEELRRYRHLMAGDEGEIRKALLEGSQGGGKVTQSRGEQSGHSGVPPAGQHMMSMLMGEGLARRLFHFGKPRREEEKGKAGPGAPPRSGDWPRG